ncbi:MAG: hypothetical protein US96_C0034G0005 [Candidatus Woesebacteria bacterium GW2011_GWB1_38_5b]|uniref:Uncharacterized protein n=1 Tax=Candidatus Woesebacteria bacterium GW2011_GWB1_38_5b TaxID=1618569 RepID=A0A0G0MKU7_9BACT|nr:MAG: hypothetical protein US96_C0034G0005 [Candidatus Woesebacteria bacterium GW2011_GWB1_38_5b]
MFDNYIKLASRCKPAIIDPMKINAEWHKKNKMPKNPTEEQRIKWHIAHAKNCACWPIPKKLQEIIDKKYPS